MIRDNHINIFGAVLGIVIAFILFVLVWGDRSDDKRCQEKGGTKHYAGKCYKFTEIP